MMSLKFSPGPWKNDDDRCAVLDSNGVEVQLRRFALASGHRNQEEREVLLGNTKLAVASPMLYSHLKIILEHYEYDPALDEYYQSARKLLNSLQDEV